MLKLDIEDSYLSFKTYCFNNFNTLCGGGICLKSINMKISLGVKLVKLFFDIPESFFL